MEREREVVKSVKGRDKEVWKDKREVVKSVKEGGRRSQCVNECGNR